MILKERIQRTCSQTIHSRSEEERHQWSFISHLIVWFSNIKGRVFEKRVLRRMFGPNRDEVMGEQRKLHSGELHNLYSSPDIIQQFKSRRMRGQGMWHTWEWGEICIGLWWEKDRLKDQGIDGRMGSKWTLGRLVGGGGVC
jgi:hypothetical protein